MAVNRHSEYGAHHLTSECTRWYTYLQAGGWLMVLKYAYGSGQ